MKQGISILFAIAISFSLTSVAQAKEMCTHDSCEANITSETKPKADKKIEKVETKNNEAKKIDDKKSIEENSNKTNMDEENKENVNTDEEEPDVNTDTTSDNKIDTDIIIDTKDENEGLFIGLGGSMFNTNSINEVLKKSRYSSFSNTVFTPTIGIHFTNDNILLEGLGSFFWAQDAIATNKKSTLSAAYGLFNVGYNLGIGDFNICPLVGIGAGGFTLENEEIGTKNFEELLEKPVNSVELNNTAFLLNAGLGLTYKIRFIPEEKSEYLSVGLRGGYIFSPFNPEWKVKNSVVGTSPITTMSGPYLMLTIGG